MLADLLGPEGRQFSQEALEELTAWGRVSYRKKDNSFIPVLTDGTSLEGYIYSKDGYFGPKGTVVKPVLAPPMAFWAYAVAFRVTGDDFMWDMARNIARGNDLGDIGASPKDNPDLRKDTDCSDPYVLLGLLELYSKTRKTELLAAASRIGENILSERLYRGCFVPSREAIYARFDCTEPLALLYLHTAVKEQSSLLPPVWPSRSYFECQYAALESIEDAIVIYCQTRETQMPLSLWSAVSEGKTDEVKSLVLNRADVNPVCKFDPTIFQRLLGMSSQLDERLEARLSRSMPVLHWAVEKGHKDIVELLIAKGAEVNATNSYGDTPLQYAVFFDRGDIIQG